MAGPINFAVWQTQQAGSTVIETNNVSVSEGADIETANLSGISLSATVATGVTFTSWTCTNFPGVGDLEFPNGTTAAAVEAGLSNPNSSATNLTVPGPGRYEFTATWSDNTTETLSVRVVRPLPLAALTVTHGEVVTGGSAISETLSDTNGADITAPGAYTGALVEYPSGSTVSLSHDGNGGYTGTNPATAANGLTLVWTATVTDDYGRSSTVNKAQHMSGVGGSAVTPPSPTSQTVAFDGSLSDKTFDAFTDTDSRIDNYLVENIQTSGGTTWTGSTPGPFTAVSSAGDNGVLLLHARDSSNNVLATAVHSYSVALAQSQNLVAGNDPTRQLHAAGTTSSSSIVFNPPTGGASPYSYAATLHSDGGSSATLSGSGLGSYTISNMANGEVHIVELVATDSEGNECSSFCSVAVQPSGASSFVDVLNEDYQTSSGVLSINVEGDNTLTSTNNVHVTNAGVTTWEETTAGLDFHAQSGDGSGPFQAVHDDISSSIDYRDIIIYDMYLTIVANGLGSTNDSIGLILAPADAQSAGAVLGRVRMDGSGNYQFSVGKRGNSSWVLTDQFQLVAAANTGVAQDIRLRIVETRGEISLYADAGSSAEIPTTTLSGGLTYGRSYVLRDDSNTVGTDHIAERRVGMWAFRGGNSGSEVDALVKAVRVQKLEAQLV